MDLDQTQEMRVLPAAVAAPVPAADAADAFQRCDQCGAPADDDQRYCVVCGTHLRHASDPAARYFSDATARSRGGRTDGARAPSGRARRRPVGLGTALVLALIPVAAAIGVVAGRASNNGDTKLIQALARDQGAATVSSTAGRHAASLAGAGATRRHSHAQAKAASKKGSSKNSSSTKGAGKVISTTKYGSAQQISGFKATNSDKQQGAKDTQQVQKSTGKSYVNSQNNLPSQVVVP